jgi:putative copper export protein
MLASGLEAVRLTLHVLAASIWVGGQAVLMGTLGATRRLGPDAAQVLARAFARLAWPAYAVLVLTGFWNVSTFDWSDQTGAWKTVLVAKLLVVALAGLGVLLHARASSKTALALWGSVAGTASVAALAMGILLAG